LVLLEIKDHQGIKGLKDLKALRDLLETQGHLVQQELLEPLVNRVLQVLQGPTVNQGPQDQQV